MGDYYSIDPLHVAHTLRCNLSDVNTMFPPVFSLAPLIA
jgi:hypothetical protein